MRIARIWIAAATLSATLPAGEPAPAVIVRRMICVTGEHGDVVRLKAGDMLQVRPFDYPVVPKYLGASLAVEAREGHTLEYIGQSSTGLPAESEGRGGRMAFLKAVSPGRTILLVSLKGKTGRDLMGPASYAIDVSP